jgi:hypothetical protein
MDTSKLTSWSVDSKESLPSQRSFCIDQKISAHSLTPILALQSDSPSGSPLQPLINMFSPFRALEELFNCRPLWVGLIPQENILRESLSGKYITINTENGESG